MEEIRFVSTTGYEVASFPSTDVSENMWYWKRSLCHPCADRGCPSSLSESRLNHGTKTPDGISPSGVSDLYFSCGCGLRAEGINNGSSVPSAACNEQHKAQKLCNRHGKRGNISHRSGVENLTGPLKFFIR